MASPVIAGGTLRWRSSSGTYDLRNIQTYLRRGKPCVRRRSKSAVARVNSRLSNDDTIVCGRTYRSRCAPSWSFACSGWCTEACLGKDSRSADHVNPAGSYIKESDRRRTSLNNSSRCLSSKTNCCFTQPRSGCFSTCSHMTCHRRSLTRSAEASLRSLHCYSCVTAATCRYMLQACTWFSMNSRCRS